MRKLKIAIWPYQLIISTNNENAEDRRNTALRQEWCENTLEPLDWYSYTVNYATVYAFKDEAIMLIFKLTLGR